MCLFFVPIPNGGERKRLDKWKKTNECKFYSVGLIPFFLKKKKLENDSMRCNTINCFLVQQQKVNQEAETTLSQLVSDKRKLHF